VGWDIKNRQTHPEPAKSRLGEEATTAFTKKGLATKDSEKNLGEYWDSWGKRLSLPKPNTEPLPRKGGGVLHCDKIKSQWKGHDIVITMPLLSGLFARAGGVVS